MRARFWDPELGVLVRDGDLRGPMSWTVNGEDVPVASVLLGRMEGFPATGLACGADALFDGSPELWEGDVVEAAVEADLGPGFRGVAVVTRDGPRFMADFLSEGTALPLDHPGIEDVVVLGHEWGGPGKEALEASLRPEPEEPRPVEECLRAARFHKVPVREGPSRESLLEEVGRIHALTAFRPREDHVAREVHGICDRALGHDGERHERRHELLRGVKEDLDRLVAAALAGDAGARRAEKTTEEE